MKVILTGNFINSGIGILTRRWNKFQVDIVMTKVWSWWSSLFFMWKKRWCWTILLSSNIFVNLQFRHILTIILLIILNFRTLARMRIISSSNFDLVLIVIGIYWILLIVILMEIKLSILITIYSFLSIKVLLLFCWSIHSSINDRSKSYFILKFLRKMILFFLFLFK